MPRKPIGTSPMSATERSRRRRAKAKAVMRDAAPPPDVVTVLADGSQLEAIAGRPAEKPGNTDYPRMLYHPDGRTTVVDTREHHDRLKPDGGGTIPRAKHLQRPVWHHGIPRRQ